MICNSAHLPRTKIQLYLFLLATDDAMRSSRAFRRFIHFSFRGDPSEKSPYPTGRLSPKNLCRLQTASMRGRGLNDLASTGSSNARHHTNKPIFLAAPSGPRACE